MPVTRQKSLADVWSSYRDWFLVLTMLVGWGAIYGQLTTRVADDEARISAMQAYITQQLVPRHEHDATNVELQARLSSMQATLNSIQTEIFQIEEEKRR